MSLLGLFNAPVSFYALTADSRRVDIGSLFLAYPGEKTDGRDYIQSAISNGAAGVMFESADFEWKPEWQVPKLAVPNLRQQAGYVASEFYGNPSEKLWMIGVTGTNGKTSVSQWLAQAFDMLHKKTAVIGTIGNGFLGNLVATANTTPDAILLQSMLRQYLEEDAACVAMEVSSHGLDQGRLNGVSFDVAVLTNLTRDHLDYHGNMQSYARAKSKLFEGEHLRCAVINVDDEFGLKIASALKAKGKQVLTYGMRASADVYAKKLELSGSGIHINVCTPQGDVEIHANVIGRFNASNLLAVLATLLASDVDFVDAVKVCTAIKPIVGRMQVFGGGQLPFVVVDYAHTPDALNKVLSTLKEQFTQKLVCVFGCGGNRDVGKRPLMGDIASKYADAVVVTSDNPRNENPATIISAITANLKDRFLVEQDRAKAIAIAILSAKAGDVVLIAGKGHEDYQEIAGVKHHFSDVEQVEAALALHQEAWV